MPLQTGFALSALEYDLVWNDLGLGAMRYPLEVPSNGRTMAERDEMRASVAPALAERGLLNGGRVSADLEDCLRVLSAPQVVVDLLGFSKRPLRAAVAAAANGDGVLGILEGNRLVLRPIRDTALVASIVSVVPALPAGPGQSMSIPFDAMSKAALAPDDNDDFGDDPFGSGDDRTETDVLVRLGVSYSDASALTELANSRIGGGQFGVQVAGRRGGRMRRAESMVTWFDTPRGRYLMFSDGSWVSLAPAGPDRIAWRIEQTMQELQAD
ncbi:MAG TPA: ESX secretion-associated protein EspG [Pseudonocardiaceae bacterium]|jgi:hypothetical protein|nr:ESX secretion-associated protein EspG [Pseudonocardiaceae bacterium]